MGKRITFVLGAGASKPYGLPLGGELTRQIYSLAAGSLADELYELGVAPVKTIHKFVSQFRHSATASVDSFIANQGQYSVLAKKALAALLLQQESHNAIFDRAYIDGDPDTDWCRYFINATFPRTFEELDLSDYAFVTFNYDRSLEYYLHTVIKHRYDVHDDAAFDKLATLKIVHFYGSLGELDPRADRYVGYNYASRESVDVAWRGIEVIPEGRDDSLRVACAKELLADARSIVFLGFGFDDDNLKRLDFRGSCSRVLGGQPRPVSATTKGLTKARVDWLTSKIRGDGMIISKIDSGVGFLEVDSLQLLREILAFGGGK